MASGFTEYRRLPGRRRGIFNGSSVWLGPDHLLLVKSQRVREDYKRFYLRDVQAIAVARAPRFHISTRALGVLALWLAAYIPASILHSRYTGALWLVPAALATAWIYISAYQSCVCRIYTAVSGERLPSVYRTWTARRFLAAVEPRILAVQGAMEGNVADVVEDLAVGPQSALPPAPRSVMFREPPPASAPVAPLPAGLPERCTEASDVLLAGLFFEALADIVALGSSSAVFGWLMTGLLVAQIGAAVVIFVQRNRGRIASGMQKLALAKLIWIAVMFYANSVMVGVAAARGGRVNPDAVGFIPSNSAALVVDAIGNLALFVVGAFLVLRREENSGPPSLL